MNIKKDLICTILMLVAIILFFMPASICRYVVSSVLFYFAFKGWGILHFINQHIKKNKKLKYSNIAIFFVISIAIFITECSVGATIMSITNNSQKINFYSDIEKDLFNVFQNYKIAQYTDPILEQRPCDMENRFTYILISINAINETNQNINNRYKNIHKRQKNYMKNVTKINKRKQIAKEAPLIVEVPNIYEQKINLEQPYERVLICSKQIKHNIENPECSSTCAFNHIDSASLQIINELDSVRKEQDIRNDIITKLERKFDELEVIQRQEEQKLTAKGF